MTPLQLASILHEAYERLAPSFGYETRPETREFRPASPNGQLMIGVCKELLDKYDVTHKEVTYRCQRCGSSRPTYIPIPCLRYHDPVCNLLDICPDCGQVQGKWPYPLSDYQQAEGRLHRSPNEVIP